MENYSEETLSKLDEIIDKLNNNIEVNPNDDDNKYFSLLFKKNWIFNHINEQGNFSIIRKSKEFDSLLLGGNFSQRYYSEKKTPMNVIINKSNIAIGNTGNTIQNLSIDISGFNSYFDSAIKEIDETDKLLKDEKEELKELLSDIKIDLDNKTEPKKSLLKRIGKYSEKIISIKKALVKIMLIKAEGMPAITIIMALRKTCLYKTCFWFKPLA